MYRSFAGENDNWTYHWARYLSGRMLDCNLMCYGCIVLDVCWFISNIGRKGGASRWPVHIVLLICEMLVNGTPPTAVPANLQSTQAAFVGIEAKELPSVNFVRQCRTVLQNLNETLSALRLGRAENWYQLFTDGTSRRQIAFQNMVIALMEDGTLDPVIVSSCMVVEDETSDMQVKSILDTVSFCSCISLCLFLFHI